MRGSRQTRPPTPSTAPGGGAETRTVVHGSALLFWAQVAGNAGFFVAVLLLARGLGPEGRGAIAFFIVTAMVAARLARVGVAEATTVFAAQLESARPVLLVNLVLFASLASLLLGGLAAVSVYLVRPLDGAIGDGELALLAAGTVAFALVEAGNAFLLGSSRFRERAIITVIGPWLYALLVALLLVTVGLTVPAAAAVWVAAHAGWAGLLIVASVRGIGLGRPDLSLMRDSVRFGLRAWVGTLSSFLSVRVDQIILAVMATQAVLGVYAVAVNASEVLLYLPEAMAASLVPLLARSAPAARAEQALRSFRFLVLTTVALAAAAALVGPPLLPIFFGPAFVASAEPFLWLLPGAIGFAALRVFSSALMASSAPGASSLGPLVSLGLGVALDVILIPRFGATGAAAAASAAFLAGGAVAALAYRARSPFRLGELLPRRADVAPASVLRTALALSPFVLRARDGIARARSLRS